MGFYGILFRLSGLLKFVLETETEYPIRLHFVFFLYNIIVKYFISHLNMI